MDIFLNKGIVHSTGNGCNHWKLLVVYDFNRDMYIFIAFSLSIKFSDTIINRLYEEIDILLNKIDILLIIIF